MNNNKLKMAMLLLWMVLLLYITMAGNSGDMEVAFKFNEPYDFLGNLFILLFCIYLVLLERMINIARPRYDVKGILKVIGIALLTFMLTIPFGYEKFTFLLANSFVIWMLRKEVKSILLTVVLVLLFGVGNYFYTKMENERVFAFCQASNLSEAQVDSCVDKYSYHHARDQYIGYLTYRNQQLARGDDKIKKNIERKIIEQNHDENCTINKNYTVTNWRKEGGPCVGGGYG